MSVGALILFALLGMAICAKARVAGGAVAFALIALTLFVATPVGRELPGAIGRFVATLDDAVTPTLNGRAGSGR